jgi:pimeloyl-ACP methyl ester carboxylesterase
MPGFGRTPAPSSLLDAATELEILNLYCAFYSGFLDSLNITKPYVVAHSFGGFVFTHCAARWPRKISRLLLSDVPGFFSTNGGLDYYWATFFVLGLPHTLLRYIGSWGHGFIATILDAFDVELDLKYLDYWLLVGVLM